LKSIKKFNLDKRGMKLSQSYSGGVQHAGTTKSCQHGKLILDKDDSQMFSIKVVNHDHEYLRGHDGFDLAADIDQKQQEASNDIQAFEKE